MYALNRSDHTTERFQQIFSELAELQVELVQSDIEPGALTLIQDAVYRMRMIALAFVQGLERFRLSHDKQALLVLLTDERMHHASQLNAEISKDFQEGRIRTDHAALSAYFRVLNQVMEEVDSIFGSRRIES